ncbi:MAG: glutamate-5-semialdehyde dehydrogenase [Candidatus Gracilibacteria bacterium]|nr:glutamate-5-semialdehyde dehydrogenase [Candidatus Gracilibacteria bacterium]
MDLNKILKKIREAGRELNLVENRLIDQIILKVAKAIVDGKNEILKANKKDLNKISKDDPVYDRILLTEERIKEIADSLKVISCYHSPIGKILEEKKLKNGLILKKISVPFGVVGVIFEARPNVIVDVFAICLKSKNACVLKDGSSSENSNKALMKIIQEVLKEILGSNDMAVLLPNDREIVGEFLKANKYVDVIIPRGGKGLIDFVRENSSIPVIETGAGVVHTYVDEFGDIEKAMNIVFNAKTSRPSVCNALDTLIVHEKNLKDLGKICERLAEKKVVIYADENSYKALAGKYPKNLLFKAKKEHFGMEFLSLKMSIKTVANLESAIAQINEFGSGHSEAIITENKKNAEKFLKMVDAACVYVNASTRFTDGGIFGLGAEIGISTQKLHARGPMGTFELTSYKWEIIGDGQAR